MSTVYYDLKRVEIPEPKDGEFRIATAATILRSKKKDFSNGKQS